METKTDAMQPSNTAVSAEKKERAVLLRGVGRKDPFRLDGRSRIVKLEKKRKAELVQMLCAGGVPDIVEATLIVQAVRFSLINDELWSAISHLGVVNSSGDTIPAVESYGRLSGQEREVLRYLDAIRLKYHVVNG